ncbi:MAG: 50S ribosome-binding GTPase, partial [bacterium]|nr:50S ribosome-binding GTPase [bacterium]
MKPLPIIAIVGEPNVGKSTLLNKIAGEHLAITSQVAGTTRDRQYSDTSWNGVDFTMVDTAGITFGNQQELEAALAEQ